ncbi:MULTISPECIES: mevalonate kinase [Archaeoglobus]|jgi:mevalonate kinase|uniref:Mevalonate kinase n=2 Tax=Archaeoglobus fulgidus TaxID=2234 RepID=A0A075WNY6_ARCFL|nr:MULTISPECIES: mevalonate kinase [Archaeoglobus]AIG99298.1 mevalonate kinase [Archaeoglobus fulgidus DSM 8774]KUJ92833.1 MAG: Mevalonate kinase [Archaeoglobus fulgidus]KUK06273.1 MAG: Mevalonate kinase [Archaeoglobus fulgidus]MDI3497014.1 mevalonate kinase [Archaeoglobus sp.]
MIASAPGKIILFGEHAVVYGRHAVVSAINLRCRVSVRKSDRFLIRSSLGESGLDYQRHPYVVQAVKRFGELRNIPGAEIEIESEIPIGSGLGSSAAVIVATIAALNAEFDGDMDKESIFQMAKQVEIDVQGRASGIDPFISTFGASWLFPERRKVEMPFKFFVINFGSRSTAEMVAKVAELRERHPEVVDKIFDAIDAISLEASDVGSAERLEELIAINQSLLRAIGVSNPEIDRTIAELERMGLKAKITGAGGGGCIFGLFKGEKPKGSFIVEPEKEGVRIEE